MPITEEQYMASVREDCYNIEVIPKPSWAVQMAAVSQNGMVLRWIKSEDQFESVKKAAVEQNGYALQYADRPSHAVEKAAVEQAGRAIQYVNEPTPEIQMAAVLQDYEAIEYIKAPIERAQMESVKHDGNQLLYIEKPTMAVITQAIDRTPSIIFDERNSAKITPAVLDEIRPGLSGMVQSARALASNPDEAVELLNEMDAEEEVAAVSPGASFNYQNAFSNDSWKSVDSTAQSRGQS